METVLVKATIDDVDFLAKEKMDSSLWFYEESVPDDEEKTRGKIIERLDSDWFKQYIIKLDDKELTPIGEFHIHWYVKERKSWEIGYCILPQFRGKGYCLKAGKKILEMAFTEWGAHKVVAMCNEENKGSYRLMERLGMSREGIFRKELFWRDKWVDQYFYSILEDEFRTNAF